MQRSLSRFQQFILLFILGAYLALGALYALRTPPWETPDEPAHFNYVRQLAEQATLPVLQIGDYDPVYLEKLKAGKFPPSLSIDSIRYESHQPPLYYALAAPIYLAARPLGLFPAVYALRLFSLLLGLGALWFGFRILSAIFPRDPLIILGAIGLVASIPMHLAMTAAVNNDTLADLVLAGLIWIAVLRGNGRMQDRAFVVWGGLGYTAALITKTTIYFPGAMVLIAAEGLYRFRLWPPAPASSPASFRAEPGPATTTAIHSPPPRVRERLAQSLKILLPLFGFALLLTAAWFVRNASLYGPADLLGLSRHDAVVVGQPTTAEWIARYGLKNIVADFFIISFKSFWAQFGWMGVLVNDRIYVTLFLLTACALLGLSFGIWRLGRAGWPARAWSRVLAPAEWEAGSGVALLHLVLICTFIPFAVYNFKYVQPQGRYLFPALLAIAALLVLGIRELVAERYRAAVFVLLYLVLLVLDYISLVWFIVPQLT